MIPYYMQNFNEIDEKGGRRLYKTAGKRTAKQERTRVLFSTTYGLDINVYQIFSFLQLNLISAVINSIYKICNKCLK